MSTTLLIQTTSTTTMTKIPSPSPIEWTSYNIRQPFPDLSPNHYFGPFDYASKSYADILDSIAVIVALWLATTILTDVATLMYRSDTRTLVIRDVLDRLLQLSVTPFCSINSLGYTRPKLKPFMNIRLRLVATFFFALCLAIEVLFIYSQTSSTKERGLDDLNLKQVTLRANNTFTEDHSASFNGCMELVDRAKLNSPIPLFFCMETSSKLLLPKEASGAFQIILSLSDEHYFRMQFASPSYLLHDFNFSVQLKNDLSNTRIFANLTALKFKLSADILATYSNRYRQSCPLCAIKVNQINGTEAQISVSTDDARGDFFNATTLSLLELLTLSPTYLRGSHFLRNDRADDSSEGRLINRITAGKVKRLSGTILWLFVCIFWVFQKLISYLSVNVDDILDDAVRYILRNEPNDMLKIQLPCPFEITDVPQVDSEDSASCEDNLDEDNTRHFDLTLTPKTFMKNKKGPSI